jgi:hypothetical protein
MAGKGIFASQIAQRLGVKNVTMLNLVGYLAEADLTFADLKAGEDLELAGTVNGEAFNIVISGPGARAVFEKIRA